MPSDFGPFNAGLHFLHLPCGCAIMFDTVRATRDQVTYDPDCAGDHSGIHAVSNDGRTFRLVNTRPDAPPPRWRAPYEDDPPPYDHPATEASYDDWEAAVDAEQGR